MILASSTVINPAPGIIARENEGGATKFLGRKYLAIFRISDVSVGEAIVPASVPFFGGDSIVAQESEGNTIILHAHSLNVVNISVSLITENDLGLITYSLEDGVARAAFVTPGSPTETVYLCVETLTSNLFTF